MDENMDASADTSDMDEAGADTDAADVAEETISDIDDGTGDDVPDDIPEDTGEDDTSDIDDGAGDDVPDDIPEDTGEDDMSDIDDGAGDDIPDDIPEDTGEDDTSDIDDGVGDDVPDDIPEDTGEDDMSDIDDGAGDDIPDDIPEDTGEDDTSDIDDGTGDDVPDDILEDTGEDDTSDIDDGAGDDIPDDILEDTGENDTSDIDEGTGDDVPDDIQENAVDGVNDETNDTVPDSDVSETDEQPVDTQEDTSDEPRTDEIDDTVPDSDVSETDEQPADTQEEISDESRTDKIDDTVPDNDVSETDEQPADTQEETSDKPHSDEIDDTVPDSDVSETDEQPADTQEETSDKPHSDEIDDTVPDSDVSETDEQPADTQEETSDKPHSDEIDDTVPDSDVSETDEQPADTQEEISDESPDAKDENYAKQQGNSVNVSRYKNNDNAVDFSENSTPMERLTDYMNKHGYGSDDFPTYSQDPEWKELHGAAYPDYKQPTVDGADTQSDAIQNLSDYMNKHGYGSGDFPTYSQDPEWKELHGAAYPDYKQPTVDGADTQSDAIQNLSDYMNKHGYGSDDFPTYSQDPEWKELHGAAYPDYKQPTVDGADTQSDAIQNLSDYMNKHGYGSGDFPTYSQDPEWQKLHGAAYPEYKSFAANDIDADELVNGIIPSSAFTGTGDLSDINDETRLEHLSQHEYEMLKVNDPERASQLLTDYNDRNIPADDLPNLSRSLALDNSNDFEVVDTDITPEKATICDMASGKEYTVYPNPMARLSHMAGQQGKNNLGMHQDCGVASTAKGINDIYGKNVTSENRLVDYAYQTNNCDIRHISLNQDGTMNYSECGGTEEMNVRDLYRANGIDADAYINNQVPDMDELGEYLKDGGVLTAAVNHDLLWNYDAAQTFDPATIDLPRYQSDKNYAAEIDTYMDMHDGVGTYKADHFVNVSNAVYDSNGALTHFIVSDTGNGTTKMIPIDYFQRAYNGLGNISVSAQGCVVAGRKK